MKRPSDHELIDLALGRLEPSRREEVEAWLRNDVAMSVRAREIREHLYRYDTLPPAPPAPALERVARDLPARPSRPGGAAQRRSAAPVAAVALGLAVTGIFVILLLRVGGVESPRLVDPIGEAGRGITVTRHGQRTADRTLRARDVLEARVTDRVALGDGVEIVLESGARLEVVDPGLTHLTTGRAFFEVTPGRPFSVLTHLGTVQVRGTAFEVHVHDGTHLDVRVASGRVTVDEQVLMAGYGLRDGIRYRLLEAPGTFFRRPVLEIRAPARVVPGRPVAFDFTLKNPGWIPMDLPGPEGVRVALWIEVTDPQDRTTDVPVDLEHADLVPGRSLRLSGLGTTTFRADVAGPFRERGIYRCRAMYRPEGEPPLVSDTVTFEVR